MRGQPLLRAQKPQTIPGVPLTARLCPKDSLCLQAPPTQTGCLFTPVLSPALTCNHWEGREAFVAAPQPRRPVAVRGLARTTAAVSAPVCSSTSPSTLLLLGCKSTGPLECHQHTRRLSNFPFESLLLRQ